MRILAVFSSIQVIKINFSCLLNSFIREIILDWGHIEHESYIEAVLKHGTQKMSENFSSTVVESNLSFYPHARNNTISLKHINRT